MLSVSEALMLGAREVVYDAQVTTEGQKDYGYL